MRKILLSFIAIAMCAFTGFAQSTLTVGGGAFTNASNLYGIMRSINTANSWNRNAYIYPASLVNAIPANSTISSLEFNASNGSSAALPAGANFKIYMKNTTSADFGAANLDWTTEIATATLVYNADPAAIVGTTSGFKQFPLISPFTYTGDNLEILVEYTQTTAPTTTILWTYDSDAGVPAYTVNQGKYINGTGTPTASLTNSNQRHPNMRINYTAFVFANDMAVTALVSPASNNITTGTPIPITATVKNNGSTSQTSVPVYYRVDGGTPVGPVNTTGTMAQNATQNVTLPNYTPTSGYHTIKVYTALATDQNIPNDTLTYNIFAGPVSAYPFFENFTYGYGWTANANIWGFATVTTEANGVGGRSIRANFYGVAASAPADTLRSPTLNLTGLTKPVMAYNFTHQTVTASAPEPDTLKIIVSTNGGTSWSAPIFVKAANGSPSLNTIAASGTSYNPQAKGDWRHELIDLSAYAGQSNVKIGFIAISGFGNQLVMDNILISNADAYTVQSVTTTGVQPTASDVTINFTSIIPNGKLKTARFTGAPPTTPGTVQFASNSTATTQDGSIFTPTRISNVWYTVTYDSTVSYSISIDISTLSNAPSKNKLYIVKRSSQNDSWVAVNTTLAGNVLTATGLTAFSDFAIAGDANNPLPVTYVMLAGTKDGNLNKLNWTTVAEQNNKGFELQRSLDGKNFGTIDFISSKAKDGFSNNSLSYNYLDEINFKGDAYYRLRQLDNDGKSTLSQIVIIKGLNVKGVDISSIYPNPVTDRLNVVVSSEISRKANISIVDLSGKLLVNQLIKLTHGNNTIAIETSQLAPGSYLLKLVCDDGVDVNVQKFIKH